jgi:hypothetical protein
VRRLALNMPAISAITSLGVRFLAGLIFGLFESFDVETGQFDWALCFQILLGSVIAGFVTAVILLDRRTPPKPARARCRCISGTAAGHSADRWGACPERGRGDDDAQLSGVPLLVGQKVVGTLELAGVRKGAFDEHARQLLETIAPQAAIAIDNAVQVLQRERRLKEQIAQLRIQIDQSKRDKQVAEITETDCFQQLQEKPQQMWEERVGRSDNRLTKPGDSV